MPRVAVLGGGPIGLDAALAFVDDGWDVTVLEAGPRVGEHVRAWGHVPLFTPWSMNVSDRVRRHLAVPDDTACPTGDELAERLLEPLADLLDGAVRTGVRVLDVGRRGLLKHEAIGGPARDAAPFRVVVSEAGGERVHEADLVLDATGSYGFPNALGAGGVPAPGERAITDRIVRHLPGPATVARWAGRRVLLVGAGKSAQTAARDLAAAGVEVLWAVRAGEPDWGAIPGDTLPERQALVDLADRARAGGLDEVEVRTGAQVDAVRPHGDGVLVDLDVDGVVEEAAVDHVLALTGYAGDAGLYRQLQVHECYATGAPMNLAAALLAAAGDGPADCLAQPAQGIDVLRSPEPDFFVLGAKSYGRSSAFLLTVGYGQVDEVAAAYRSAAVPA